MPRRTVAGHASRAIAIAAPSAPQTPAVAPTLEIGNEIVRAYKHVLGRGPTKSHVHFAGADTLVVVLEDTMTAQERSLASLGEEAPVQQYRLLVTGSLEDRLRSIVEGAIGRPTLARISGFDPRRDVAVEIFTLAPEPTD